MAINVDITNNSEKIDLYRIDGNINFNLNFLINYDNSNKRLNYFTIKKIEPEEGNYQIGPNDKYTPYIKNQIPLYYYVKLKCPLVIDNLENVKRDIIGEEQIYNPNNSLIADIIKIGDSVTIESEYNNNNEIEYTGIDKDDDESGSFTVNLLTGRFTTTDDSLRIEYEILNDFNKVITVQGLFNTNYLVKLNKINNNLFNVELFLPEINEREITVNYNKLSIINNNSSSFSYIGSMRTEKNKLDYNLFEFNNYKSLFYQNISNILYDNYLFTNPEINDYSWYLNYLDSELPYKKYNVWRKIKKSI